MPPVGFVPALEHTGGKTRTGRSAAGVRAIKLKSGDEVAGIDLISEGRPSADEQLLVVMSNGYGKRTKLKEYKVQGRGGSGIKTMSITAKTKPSSRAWAAILVHRSRRHR